MPRKPFTLITRIIILSAIFIPHLIRGRQSQQGACRGTFRPVTEYVRDDWATVNHCQSRRRCGKRGHRRDTRNGFSQTRSRTRPSETRTIACAATEGRR